MSDVVRKDGERNVVGIEFETKDFLRWVVKFGYDPIFAGRGVSEDETLLTPDELVAFNIPECLDRRHERIPRSRHRGVTNMAEESLRINIELTPSDMTYFRERLKNSRGERNPAEEASVIKSAASLVEEALAVDSPEFVTSRLVQLEKLIDMASDPEWRLEGRDRAAGRYPLCR